MTRLGGEGVGFMSVSHRSQTVGGRNSAYDLMNMIHVISLSPVGKSML